LQMYYAEGVLLSRRLREDAKSDRLLEQLLLH
jgi:hypothetical protein